MTYTTATCDACGRRVGPAFRDHYALEHGIRLPADADYREYVTLDRNDIIRAALASEPQRVSLRKPVRLADWSLPGISEDESDALIDALADARTDYRAAEADRLRAAILAYFTHGYSSQRAREAALWQAIGNDSRDVLRPYCGPEPAAEHYDD